MITNFKKIGEYVQPNQYAIYEKFIGKNKSKKIPIVYLLVVNNEIKYIGESRRGYTRPLSFNKNKVMNKQRKEIYKATSSNQKVEVFAYEVPFTNQIINGLKIEIYTGQDYEKALIKKYEPEWNGRT